MLLGQPHLLPSGSFFLLQMNAAERHSRPKLRAQRQIVVSKERLRKGEGTILNATSSNRVPLIIAIRHLN